MSHGGWAGGIPRVTAAKNRARALSVAGVAGTGTSLQTSLHQLTNDDSASARKAANLLLTFTLTARCTGSPKTSEGTPAPWGHLSPTRH